MKYEEVSDEERAMVDRAVEEVTEYARSAGCTCLPAVAVLISGLDDSEDQPVVGVSLRHNTLCHGLLRQKAKEGNN